MPIDNQKRYIHLKSTGTMDFLTNPDRFLERQKEKGIITPVITVLVAAILSSLTVYITAPAILESLKMKILELDTTITESQLEVMLKMIYYSMIVTPFIATFVIWIVLTLVLFLISGIFSGSGKFSTLAKLVAYSYIPAILLSPASAYIAYESTKYMLYGVKSYLIPSLTLQIAIVAWQALYWAYAVKNARNLNLRNSAITALIVLIAYLFLTVFFLIPSPSEIL